MEVPIPQYKTTFTCGFKFKLWKLLEKAIYGQIPSFILWSIPIQNQKEQLKEYYKEVLSEGGFSDKGGGGLGMIDIARKSGQKLNYHFTEIDETFSFFNLNIKITQ